MFKQFLSLIFILFFLLVCSTICFAENLLQNSSFEEEYMNSIVMWTFDAFLETDDAVRFFINRKDSHSGDSCLGIATLKPNDARVIQWVKVKPEVYYRLSCWVKVIRADEMQMGANITVLGIRSTSKDLRNTNGKWEYVEIYGKTDKEQTELPVVARLGFYGNLTTGLAYYDDIILEEVEEMPQKPVIDFGTGYYMRENNENEMRPLLIIIIIILIIIITSSSIILIKTGQLQKIYKIITIRFLRKKNNGEKRKYKRKRYKLYISILQQKPGGYTKKTNLRTRDISLGGVFVESRELSLYKINERVEIEIFYKNNIIFKGQAEIIRSEIVYNKKKVIVKSGYGISFNNPDSEYITRLKTVLNLE